jgi:hypothetical protein
MDYAASSNRALVQRSYEVTASLGRGAMREVLRPRDGSLDATSV